MEGPRTYFVYDGDQILCELDEAGQVVATNTWGADGLASRHTKLTDGTNTFATLFYVWDERGNLAQRLDSQQQVTRQSTFTD